MAACHIEPNDKKKLIGEVGQTLVKTYGKKKYYTPAQVKRAAETRGYPVDIHCWAYSVYLTPQDFELIHAAAGDACDYAAMKASVLTDLASEGSYSLLDINLSWLEWPDIDLSALFDISP